MKDLPDSIDANEFNGHAQFLTVYTVERHYGGPEEGDWWYNWWTELYRTTNPIPVKRINKVYQKLIRRFGYLHEGNIYSVNGGLELHIHAERTPGISASKHVPHYC